MLASERALRAHAEEARRVEQAEAAARAAQRRYQLVSDLMSDLVGVFDEQGRVVYASPSFQRILGVDPLSIVGRPTPELIHPEDLEATGAAFLSTVAEGKATAVARVKAADGSYRWFHIGLSRMNAEAGEQGIIAVSARDITEQRELSEALEATRRMEALGRLAGGVAHDFNNMLMVIQSASDLASSRLPSEHAARIELSEVNHAIQRAAALTQQLLTFARRQVLPGDASSVVAHVVRDLCPILARLCGSDIELQTRLDGSARRVDVSPVQIEQLLMNLCANARDAMPSGGTLKVTLADRELLPREIADLKPGSYVELIVEDSGSGISPEVQLRMFEPFFTTKSAGRGTGLGLATVFGLVNQLGGHIGVRSELGRGTAFTLLLPESHGTHARESERIELKSLGARPLSILVVEDERAVRTLIARILTNAGHRVTEAESIEHALAASEAPDVHFEAIVTDVVLGAGDGIALLERIRKRHPRAAVVVVSGFSPSPERVAELASRGAEFLPKPFGSEALLSALSSARRSREA
ncbi:MAG: ATP-binding protein [Polyangiaceae bacterium]